MQLGCKLTTRSQDGETLYRTRQTLPLTLPTEFETFMEILVPSFNLQFACGLRYNKKYCISYQKVTDTDNCLVFTKVTP